MDVSALVSGNKFFSTRGRLPLEKKNMIWVQRKGGEIPFKRLWHTTTVQPVQFGPQQKTSKNCREESCKDTPCFGNDIKVWLVVWQCKAIVLLILGQYLNHLEKTHQSYWNHPLPESFLESPPTPLQKLSSHEFHRIWPSKLQAESMGFFNSDVFLFRKLPRGVPYY